MRDLIVTQKGIFLVGRETIAKGQNKGQVQEIITRHIPFEQLFQVPIYFLEQSPPSFTHN